MSDKVKEAIRQEEEDLGSLQLTAPEFQGAPREVPGVGRGERSARDRRTEPEEDEHLVTDPRRKTNSSNNAIQIC